MNGLGQLGQLGRTSDAERPSCNLAKISLLLWTRPNRPDFRGRAAELQPCKDMAIAVDSANSASSAGLPRPSGRVATLQAYGYCCGLGQLGQIGRTSEAERPSCNLVKIWLLLWTRPTRPIRPDFRGRTVELIHANL